MDGVEAKKKMMSLIYYLHCDNYQAIPNLHKVFQKYLLPIAFISIFKYL